MPFERSEDVEAKRQAEEGKPIEIPDEDRGPVARECTMDTWSPDGKLAQRRAPKARFTIPAGWCVAPGFEDWPAERDSWSIVPEFLVNDRPYPGIDIDITLQRLRTKDARTQSGRAVWYKDIFRKGDPPLGRMRLFGPVKVVSTKQFGSINVYHFRSESGQDNWNAYLFGKRSVVEIELTDREACAADRFLGVVEMIARSVSLREN
jgi:hypothetical protein